MSEQLQTVARRLDPLDRAQFRDDPDADGRSAVLQRPDGEAPTMAALDSLLHDFHRRAIEGAWPDRSSSDRWLAPRMHYALRLHRSEAADRGVWQWVALRYGWYLEWRWADSKGIVAEDRWWGPVHKQAFARLWWGAEVFRDGPDYRPVERAFLFQDLPNSYLHRPLVRCRSLALAIVDRATSAGTPSSDQVNDLARVLNLATVGSPPEVETDYQADDLAAYCAWVSVEAPTCDDWSLLPAGPAATDTTPQSGSSGFRVR